MYTIIENIEHEIVINKSQFICLLIKVNSEDDVKNSLKNIKEKYKDATHVCYSYIIDNVKRFNDDGEPGGTAGMPILNVLENNHLNHILAVVVRYFGGIKLGAGGLVRAYSKSVSETLNKSIITKLLFGKKITIRFSYDKIKLIDNILKDVTISNKLFNELISYEIMLSNEEYKEIFMKLDEYIMDKKIIDNVLIEKIT